MTEEEYKELRRALSDIWTRLDGRRPCTIAINAIMDGIRDLEYRIDGFYEEQRQSMQRRKVEHAATHKNTKTTSSNR